MGARGPRAIDDAAPGANVHRDVPAPYATACPRCGRAAPTIARGLMTFCTACGRERLPLGSTVVNVAGKPSRVGGTVARVLGALAIVLGLVVGAVVYGLAAWIFPGSPLPYLGVALGGLGVTLGVLLLLGGRKLAAGGAAAEHKARAEALRSLAAHRGGLLTARDAAAAIGVDDAAADAVLTAMAKDANEHVTVEIDDEGGVYYAFPSRPQRFAAPREPARVDDVERELWAEDEAAAGHDDALTTDVTRRARSAR
jgi:hypothetical protein